MPSDRAHAQAAQVAHPRRKSPLVITGFVSTGKTSVGRIVAGRLGWRFVDTDALIQERQGRAVQEIYATQGPPALRTLESELCAELAALRETVIATGGGTLVDPRNREQFAGAFVVCLDADPGEIVARVGRSSDRPLFQGGDPVEQLAMLLHSRRAAYAAIPVHVDTTGKTIEQVAEEVISVYRKGENG